MINLEKILCPLVSGIWGFWGFFDLRFLEIKLAFNTKISNILQDLYFLRNLWLATVWNQRRRKTFVPAKFLPILVPFSSSLISALVMFISDSLCLVFDDTIGLTLLHCDFLAGWLLSSRQAEPQRSVTAVLAPPGPKPFITPTIFFALIVAA